MNRLLVVSNRLPINITKRKDRFSIKSSVGGLATGLGSFYKSYNSLWIGWAGTSISKEKQDLESKLISEYHCVPVNIPQSYFDKYYNGFCNKTIWPLFHYFPQYTIYNDTYWEAYKHVNQIFFEKLSKIMKKTDTIWIHDYQLMLLPKLVREKFPEALIGFFLHIPFPSSELFRLLPQRQKILEGLLGSDLIGFHTYDYARHFLESIHQILGHEHNFGQLTVDNHLLKIDVFPMGINYEKFESGTLNQKVTKEANTIRRKLGDRKIILSIDRLDYSKGILNRLKAFNLFLEKNPRYKEKISLILVAVPSRGEVEQYQMLKNQLDELVGKVNGRHGTIGWIPIFYINRFISDHTLIALYDIADIALITPLRDGMNLIAKEYVASKTDGKGVLILSEMAGAAKVLGEATIVNPNDITEIADAIKEALELPDKEKMNRMREMQDRLKHYSVSHWARNFMDSLKSFRRMKNQLKTKRLSKEKEKKMLTHYRQSATRLLLLDYDGTLAPFVENPEKAAPDSQLIKLLKKLTSDPRNEVVIISGRKKETLDSWFNDLNVGLAAEHGAWKRDGSKKWSMIQPLKDDWKNELQPILEEFVKRTPGSFIEEKSFSLVWHYRKADPKLGSARAMELKNTIGHLIADTDLNVLEGNKVIEIKNASINKGQIVLKWLAEKEFKFILGIGDDITDEDLFAALPKSAYSIKVGIGISKAEYNLNSPTEVRKLLKKLTRVNA